MAVTRRRGQGEGAIFRRQHLTSCGPKAVNCPHPPTAKPHGLWVGRLELPPIDGTRRQKIFTSVNKAVVVRALAEKRGDLERHGNLPSASQTVDQWVTYWLQNVAVRHVRPKTIAGYRSACKHIVAAIGNVRLDKLQPAHVRRIHEHILGRGLSSTYAANAHRIFAKCLLDAEAEGIIHRNVARLTSAPPNALSERAALTVDEAIDVIRRAIPELEGATDVYDPNPARWAMYLLTGMRRGECLGLEWDRIVTRVERDRETGEMVEAVMLDLSWQLLRIPEKDMKNAPADYEYRRCEGSLWWTRPKSDKGWRIIPLVEPLASILAAHRTRSGDNAYGLVWTLNGAPIDPDGETDAWAGYIATVTDTKVVLHGARHTTVDLLLEADVPEDVVMEIVGHSTRTVTRGYKSRTNYTRRTEAMKQLSASLGVG